VKNLNINDRQVGNVTVLDIDGNLRIGEGSAMLQKAIRRLLQEGQTRILLNLSRVDYIDSSGLGELVAGHVAMGKKGGQIKLLHLTHRVRELMTITKLLTVFDAYEDESEAIDSFKTPEVETEEQTLALAQGTAQ
jgi:anti-sigma B factor antagonist